MLRRAVRECRRAVILVTAFVVAAGVPAAGSEALPPDRLAERIRAELAFADGLASLHPDRKAEWAPLLEKARALVGSEAGPVVASAVAEAEAVLAPVAAVAKTYTVHNVGHAHIDMNWMWPWPETVAVTNDTFTTVLRLMDEFPDFRFTQSQASVYEIARRYNPALFERIKARVAEGRWEVAASQWVEGDKNLASGEAIARHLLYTRRFMEDELGLKPEDVPIDFEPDTFGHAHTIPTLVSRGGVTRYYMCRGGRDEKPPVFWWRGPDGTRVLVNLETTWYLKAVGPENTTALLAFAAKTGLRDWMNVYGVGDHGGGPTRRDIRRILEMDGWPVFPRFRFSTTRDFYAVLERNGDRFPVLDRELNFEFTGCYTSQSQIKRYNRLGESRALDAEAAAVLALRAVGRPYPVADLREAWTRVLFGQFHDILPGSGVRATREYQSGLFQQSAATFGTVQAESLRAVAAAVDTGFAKDRLAGGTTGEDRGLGAGVGRGSALGAISDAAHQADGPRPVVVFNPTGWPRDELVRTSVWDSGTADDRRDGRRFVVHAPDGRSFPAETVGQGEYWGHRFVDVVFPASVGALGYAAYVLEERAAGGPSGASPVTPLKVDAESLAFENERLSVRFDRLTGGVVQLVDKATGLDLATPGDPLALLELVTERPRDMSAWVIGDAMSRVRPLALHALAVETGNPYVATLVAKAKVGASDSDAAHLVEGRAALARGGGRGQLAGAWRTRERDAAAADALPHPARGAEDALRDPVRLDRPRAGAGRGGPRPALGRRLRDDPGAAGRPPARERRQARPLARRLDPRPHPAALELRAGPAARDREPLHASGPRASRRRAHRRRDDAAGSRLQPPAAGRGRGPARGAPRADGKRGRVAEPGRRRGRRGEEGGGRRLDRLPPARDRREGLDRPAGAGAASRHADGRGGGRPAGATGGEGHRPSRLPHRERGRARARRGERPGSIRLTGRGRSPGRARCGSSAPPRSRCSWGRPSGPSP